MIGFFRRWLTFRFFVPAVTHKTGGPGGVGPGEGLTIEVLDDFNHVTGSLFLFCIFCEIRRFVAKLAFHTQPGVEGPHNGTLIFRLLHL